MKGLRKKHVQNPGLIFGVALKPSNTAGDLTQSKWPGQWQEHVCEKFCIKELTFSRNCSWLSHSVRSAHSEDLRTTNRDSTRQSLADRMHIVKSARDFKSWKQKAPILSCAFLRTSLAHQNLENFMESTEKASRACSVETMYTSHALHCAVWPQKSSKSLKTC